ncbi:MAG: DUF2807 domain-containing protein [Bacteroidales bacterium]|nr:DUF2807 domain-containing protein [Bacteroidales bacterium]
MNRNSIIKAGFIAAASLGIMAFTMTPATAEPIGAMSSPDVVKEIRDLDPFTKIHIKGALKLHVTGGEDQHVSVEVDEDYVDDLRTSVEDGTLIIDMSREGKKKRWKGPKVEMNISMQILESIELDGAMDAELVNLSGGDLDIDISGAGNISIEGSCNTLRVNLSGAGNIEAEDFKCKNAKIRLSGAGNIEAYATEKADVRLAGIGNIDITGNPKEISKKKGGFGSIDIR